MKALILSSNPALHSAIEKICAARQPAIAVIAELPGMRREEAIVAVGEPDLMLVDAADDGTQAVALLERAMARFPQAKVILLVPADASTLLIAAMRMGIREVVTLPLQPDDLVSAIDRVTEIVKQGSASQGKIISLMSCKGGSGTTFVAANLAYALATVAGKKTLLVDLNLQFGDATLYVSDTRPSMTLSDLCKQIGRLDAELLDSSLVSVANNFGVLAASMDPDPDDSIRPDHVAAILGIAKNHYDYVLLDIGRQVNGVIIRALDMSDEICPVLQQSLPYLRNGRRMLDMFTALGYQREAIQPLVNRHESSAAISLPDMERALGHGVTYTLPNNFEVAIESINQGEPVLSMARSSNLARGLVEIARTLTHVPAPGGAGLIRRLFTRNAAAG